MWTTVVWIVLALLTLVLGLVGIGAVWGLFWRSVRCKTWFFENTAHMRLFASLHVTNAFLQSAAHSFGPFDNDGTVLRYRGVVLAQWEEYEVELACGHRALADRIITHTRAVKQISGFLSVCEYGFCVAAIKTDAARVGQECEDR